MKIGTPLLLFAVALAGCAARPDRVALPPLDDAPLVDAGGNPRSVVFSTPRLRAMGDAGPQDWYASRADERAAVTAGVKAPASLFAETITVDRQYTFHGEPRTHYSETTYRGRIIGGAQ